MSSGQVFLLCVAGLLGCLAAFRWKERQEGGVLYEPGRFIALLGVVVLVLMFVGATALGDWWRQNP